MRNATQQDVENVKKWIYPKNVMFWCNGPVHIKFDHMGDAITRPYGFRNEINILMEKAVGGDVMWVHPENIKVNKYKGPAQTPAKPKRKPKKGTKPMKTSDIEVGDYVVLRDKRCSGTVVAVQSNGCIKLSSGFFCGVKGQSGFSGPFSITKIIKAKKPISVDGSQAKLPQQFKVGDKVVVGKNPDLGGASPKDFNEGYVGIVEGEGQYLENSRKKWVRVRFPETGLWYVSVFDLSFYEEPQDTSEYIVWVNSDEFDCAILPDDHDPKNPAAKTFKGTLEQAKEMVNSLSSTFGFEPYTIYRLVKVEG